MPGHSESSMVHGTTTYRADPAKECRPRCGRVNGEEVPTQSPSNFYTKVNLAVTPSQIVPLISREGLYKQYRINEVEWMFKRTDYAIHSTGNISANYRFAESAAVMPNLMNQEVPEPGGSFTVAQIIKWMTQNKGKRLTLNDRSTTMKVSPKVVEFQEFQDLGESNIGTEVTSVKKMPWMDLSRTAMDNMSLGGITVVIPTIDVRTFYTVFADDATQGGNPGSTQNEISGNFRYEVYCRVKWSVKGKYITPVAGDLYYDENAIEEGVSDLNMSEL